MVVAVVAVAKMLRCCRSVGAVLEGVGMLSGQKRWGCSGGFVTARVDELQLRSRCGNGGRNSGIAVVEVVVYSIG